MPETDSKPKSIYDRWEAQNKHITITPDPDLADIAERARKRAEAAKKKSEEK